MKTVAFCYQQLQNNNSVSGAIAVTVVIVQIGATMSIEIADGPVEVTVVVKEDASMKNLRNLLFLALLLVSTLCGCADDQPPANPKAPLPEPAAEAVLPELPELPDPPKTPEYEEESVPLQEEKEESPEEKEAAYILNANSRKFHRPTCRSVPAIAPKNYLESTQTRDEVIASGYTPCKNCKP